LLCLDVRADFRRLYGGDGVRGRLPTNGNVSRVRGRLIDVKGAADYIGSSERHIRRLVDEKRIPYTKLGSGRSARLRFDTAKLDAWLDEHSFEPEDGS
jgi:excisionase family DNA binding protein